MEFLQEWGYIGLFIGSFLAATVVPFSSDFLLLGILVAGGDPLISFCSALGGNWIGGLTSYGFGWLGKWEWIEKWFKVNPEKLQKQKEKIKRFGSLIALLTWTPFVGDIFAVGLGFYKLNFYKSAFYMLVGKGLRYVFWLILFHYFGENIPFL